MVLLLNLVEAIHSIQDLGVDKGPGGTEKEKHMRRCDHISLLSLGYQKPFSILQPIFTDVACLYKIPASSIAAV